MTIEQLQNLLGQYKLRPDKKFGQNFLLDDEVLDEMVLAAGVGKADTVLEIGPGIGNLTHKLCVAAGQVLAIEKDVRLRKLLEGLAAEHTNLLLEFADILSFDFVSALARIPLVKSQEASPATGYKVVANIPYYVTGKLVQLLLRSQSRPRSITVLIQNEVGENMVAAPGKMNLLGLSVQLVGVPRLVRIVPAKSFYPAPKVDSAVVHIDIPVKPLHASVDEKLFFRVARACFAGKRKQIHNSLAAGLGLTAALAGRILERVGIALSDRPQNLSVQQFILLSEEVSRDEEFQGRAA